MSTLTKVLIVLLTVFSLFLCGIVVTYVASADKYRTTADRVARDKQTAEKLREKADRDLEDGLKNAKVEKEKLDTQIIALSAQITKLQGDLDMAKRENAQLVQQGASLASAAQASSAGEKEQRALFQTEHQKVQSLEADRINREKELAETSQTLLEKVTIIAQLDDKVRQLTQENQELGTKVNQYLVQYGKAAAQPPTTVVAGSPLARPIQPIAAVSAARDTRNIALNGQVTRVDLPNRLAEISIGTAAGVRQDMRFHVVRGDQFVADILILEVWPDTAVGRLDLVKTGMQPQTGDKVATNL